VAPCPPACKTAASDNRIVDTRTHQRHPTGHSRSWNCNPLQHSGYIFSWIHRPKRGPDCHILLPPTGRNSCGGIVFSWKNQLLVGLGLIAHLANGFSARGFRRMKIFPIRQEDPSQFQPLILPWLLLWLKKTQWRGQHYSKFVTSKSILASTTCEGAWLICNNIHWKGGLWKSLFSLHGTLSYPSYL